MQDNNATKLILRASIAPISVLLLHLLTLGLYDRYPNYDVITHGLGGASIAFFWFTISNNFQGFRRLPNWYKIIVVIGMVALAAISWETMEFILDQRIGMPIHQISIPNLMKDCLFGIAGGLISALLINSQRQDDFTV